jgi:lipopolysaccharide/colanic/teichoic acid biosynthesis glycosyltransferase
MATSPFPVSLRRRCLDVIVAGLALLVAAPVILLCALLVLLADGRPVLFRQARVGEHGRPFRMVKLRTMRAGPGPGVTGLGDPRVTRVGAVLRRTSLDELPQLWHVLRGEMTLVGPRPESVDLARRYPEQSRLILDVRPGLTGPTQLRFRERSATPPPGIDAEAWYLEELVPRRVAGDLDYLRDPTLRTTLGYLALTGLFVLGVVDPAKPRETAVSGPDSP